MEQEPVIAAALSLKLGGQFLAVPASRLRSLPTATTTQPSDKPMSCVRFDRGEDPADLPAWRIRPMASSIMTFISGCLGSPGWPKSAERSAGR